MLVFFLLASSLDLGCAYAPPPRLHLNTFPTSDSLKSLFENTLPLLSKKVQGAAVSSFITDSDDVVQEDIDGVPIIKRSSLTFPFFEPQTVSELSAILEGDHNADALKGIDVILPPDRKFWARALSPSSSSAFDKVAVKRSEDSSKSFPYLVSSSPLPPPATTDAPESPTLLFLHGSFHSPHCFAEHFMPFFSSHGIPCQALPLRGIESGFPASEDNKNGKVKIDEHIVDLTNYLSSNPDKEFIIFAHSFSGILLMKVLGSTALPPNVVNAGFMCSVPPSGNGPMTKRFLLRDLGLSFKITVGFVLKRVASDEKICRELFFDESLSDQDLQRWMTGFEKDSRVTIDLLDLAKKLPSDDLEAKANVEELLERWAHRPLCLGATEDNVVDKEGVDEIARFFNTKAVICESPHDVMLGRKWENTAWEILDWYRKVN